MALEQRYILNLDLKRGMTSTAPTFRYDDNAILIFDLYDNGIEYSIDDAVYAEVMHESPTGSITVYNANFTTYNGRKTVRFNYEGKDLLEAGIYKATLTVRDNRNAVTFQPFPVVIYNEQNSSSTLADLIKELNKYISDAMLSLRDAIMLWEKGVPNGVASLDANGKIPMSQMPSNISNFERHIKTLIYNEPVHGMRITTPNSDPTVDAGVAQYFIPPQNMWQNFGHSPDCVGGGGGKPTELLDVQLTKNNGTITLNYIGVPTVVLQKWDYGEREIPHFASNGTVFTGNSFTVDRIGTYTLYYKDSNGTEYVRVFTMTQADFATPTISVSVDKGDVTVNISQPTSIKKWAKGRQGIPYFQSQGNVFTGNMFRVTEVGWYTIYYKTTSGAEYTYEFEVNYAQLSGGLPIVVYSEYFNNDFGKNLRAFIIGIKDSRVTKVKYTGRYVNVGTSDYGLVHEDAGYYYANLNDTLNGFVDADSSNHNMTVEFMDDNNNVYGTAIHKCRINYNYFVVNNQYISLTRIKNSTTNYTLPSTIDGLPVLDAGCVFFTAYPDKDKWNTKNLTVPSSIISGGRFATYTRNSPVAIETIRIENENFTFHTPSSFKSFTINKAGGIVIYVPNNSETYNTVSDRIDAYIGQIQTF